MKPLLPHDPFDELIAAALHGELTPEERTQFNARLQNDAAARAAYQEAQLMHDLLEKTHKNAQPDDAFEQRMVSGVRRKIQTKEHRETAWESALFFWKWVKGRLTIKWSVWEYSATTVLVVLTAVFGLALYHDSRLARTFADNGIANPIVPHFYLPRSLFLSDAKHPQFADHGDLKKVIDKNGITYVETAQKGITLSGYLDTSYAKQFEEKSLGPVQQAKAVAQAQRNAIPDVSKFTVTEGGTSAVAENAKQEHSLPDEQKQKFQDFIEPTTTTTPQGGTIRGSGFTVPTLATISAPTPTSPPAVTPPSGPLQLDYGKQYKDNGADKQSGKFSFDVGNTFDGKTKMAKSAENNATAWDPNWIAPAKAADAPDAGRKLIRNAELELEVKSFQAAIDQITVLTKSAGGYIDTSHSQKGGNGKLQGTVVVKVLPQNLDDFLLKLRDLGKVENQSVKADDVTKDYFDTQARLENSKKMEVQLQDLLKRENGKVSDLLQVERELGRVRGEIEQMQGQLKLYDFQVQYATVTMQLREKDLNQAAAYLLKEQDDFSLFATDVEGTFQKARQSAEGFKAQILQANLNHNSGSDVSADLVVMVAPDQIEPFLADVRTMGRVANFTRQTQRVAKDGGDSDQPADQTLTEKDKVQVHLSIRSDDESRKQVALTVVTSTVDTALDQAKAAALANAGVEILSSSLNKTPQGQSTAQLSVRVPGKDYSAMIDAFKVLGRTASLSIQRNDDAGPGANGDDAPVIVSLSLTDSDTPLQETAMSVLTTGVDAQAQQIKKDAQAVGVTVTASSFARQPDGIEMAQMTFRLPMAKYPAFVESLKKLGKVESLTVRREDRPDQTRADDTAPVEINLNLHNQRDIVTDDSGLWATLRQTFGDGVGALFNSVRVIGVMIAFLLPWAVTLAILAWVGRRIYLWRKK